MDTGASWGVSQYPYEIRSLWPIFHASATLLPFMSKFISCILYDVGPSSLAYSCILGSKSASIQSKVTVTYILYFSDFVMLWDKLGYKAYFVGSSCTSGLKSHILFDSLKSSVTLLGHTKLIHWFSDSPSQCCIYINVWSITKS